MHKQILVCPHWLYGYTKECYSAIKRNKVLILVTMWINLRNIILSERSKMQRLYVVQFHLEMSRIDRSMVVIRGWKKRNWEQLFNRYKVSFWGVCSSTQVTIIEYHRLSDLSHMT